MEAEAVLFLIALPLSKKISRFPLPDPCLTPMHDAPCSKKTLVLLNSHY